MSISIFQHTQKSYSEAVFALLGKGRLHAMHLYSLWFRKGGIEGIWNAVEPQAVKLVQEMIAATDFSLPELSGDKREAETLKFLLRFSDGLESESVLIPMESGKTLCLSSQVGCRMGCSFCETGKMGLIRHLTTQEIVAQVFHARFALNAAIRNLVFMGMGEPLDNYDAVMQAIKVLTDPAGMGFGPSRITLSTSGKVEEIYRLIEDADPALNLAVSVNAPSDEVRSKLMPVNHTWDMAALKEAMRAYCAHPRREILVEYVLIQGINDALEHADLLAQYLDGLRVKVNLIPYNPQRRDRYLPPESSAKEAFLERMREKGYQTLLRGTKGQKIMAACGQLGNVEVRRELIKKRLVPSLNNFPQKDYSPA
ncbi:MAG: 23S rRNA (adenine(2503)-C(2))-methyltransferase RlmN [Rhabdochlamydiaceae bacterium]|nr:23S rRNA (adenine(2503)-C(2))-methyltransferase RlmN [Rhabdochlamydiaceae bacterium]